MGSHRGTTQAVRSTGGKQNQRAATRLILVMRGLRQLAYGLLAVLLGVALTEEGFAPVTIGILITVSLVGDVLGTYVIGITADAWGRRCTLALLALLMAGTGVIFGLTSNYPVLLVAAFFETLGTSASETAPFLPIDQAMIAQVTTPKQRTLLFARYNLVASLSTAAGALVASVPDLLTHVGLPPRDAQRDDTKQAIGDESAPQGLAALLDFRFRGGFATIWQTRMRRANLTTISTHSPPDHSFVSSFVFGFCGHLCSHIFCGIYL